MAGRIIIPADACNIERVGTSAFNRIRSCVDELRRRSLWRTLCPSTFFLSRDDNSPPFLCLLLADFFVVFFCFRFCFLSLVQNRKLISTYHALAAGGRTFFQLFIDVMYTDVPSPIAFYPPSPTIRAPDLL